MNITQLRYFNEICKYNNISKAADVCHVSQPSVSVSIKTLEEECGYKLFYRKNNQIQITPEGKAFLKITRAFLQEYENYYKKAIDIGTRQNWTLHLGLPSVMGTFFFDRIVPDFAIRYPNINLRIYEISTLDGIKKVYDNELDFLLGINNPEYHTYCKSKPVMSTNLVAVVNKDNPLAKKKKITPAMLKNQPLVLISKGSYHYQHITKLLEGIDANIIAESTQISTIKYLLQQDYAATITYKEIFENDKEFVNIPLDQPIPADIHIFWHKNAYVTSAMRKFIEYITVL